MVVFHNEPVIIGVDTGNKMMKTARSVFHSGLRKLDGAPPIQPKDPLDVIKFNNSFYVVSTERLCYNRNKTESDDYLILTLIAIAKELQSRKLSPQGAHIVLSLGLPPGHLKEDMVERYERYFRRTDGRYRYECGDISFQITVDRVLVNPQGLACLFVDQQDLLQKQDVMIIDIGGYTVDIIHLVHGSPDVEQIISLDHGTIPFYQRVIKELNSRFDRQITEQQIDHIMMDGADSESRSYFEAAHIRLIKDIAGEHVQKLFGRIKELGIDLRSTYVVFSGGGAILLREALERQAAAVGHYISIWDITANAKGYEVFAQARLTKGR